MTKRLITALIALALVLAACGGAETSPVLDAAVVAAQPTTTVSPATTQPAPPDTTEHVDDDHADDADEHMDDAAMDDDAHMDDDGMNMSLADEGAIADRTIETIMTEFAFDPGPIDVAAGETVDFVVTNEGAIQHEFRVTTKEAVEHHVDDGHADHAEAMEPGVMILEPGESASMMVTFHQAGEFDVIACLLPGHFEAGMETDLNIEG